ncbi:creatininase family protein [Geoalkalibacter halelectricus]|uniref:Creatininase family protein n=1 Tax=Geoalkalibacter halelectricus TaxID=2847045 RepID=A0ABY5ZMX3_9BACT|nr:creatininase family protein [Geoalkalibacter halelectricus]MDO3379997.1 creatininase family protein [Geoalkalibacter halelectricus]UWZ80476.1 creatininase family protein [Geoalkalibacter halelectricus]
MILYEMTMPEFERGLKKTRTVVIPFGVLEQHGSHLPLGTDTMQAEDVCRHLAARRALFVAPPIHYGVCRSTADHPGTISISTDTLKALAMEIVKDLYRQGLRCFVLLSGHAGGTHNAALLDAGETLLKQLPEAAIAVVTEYDLAAGEGRGIIETPGDAHAGEIETSRILNSRPHLVKGSSPAEVPSFPRGLLVRDKRRHWPGGVHGDPSKATADKGRRIEELVVDALERLVILLEEGA